MLCKLIVDRMISQTRFCIWLLILTGFSQTLLGEYVKNKDLPYFFETFQKVAKLAERGKSKKLWGVPI